jgi:esterase/lipase
MIWDYQEALSRRLILWSTTSIATGVVVLVLGGAFWRGFGLQAVVWGAIDGAIALFGSISSRKRRAKSPPSPETAAVEARNLRRLLWINAGLDVLYVAGGIVLLYTLGAQNEFTAGNAWGVIAQGGFLLLFDLLHALAAPGEQDLPGFDLFAGPEHVAFRLNGGEPAALLVHGFGGTPAEMRGLADVLHRQGWTADVILLPGFGADMKTLTGRRLTEWFDAIVSAARTLREAGHSPLLLVGYSMGAALSLVLAKTIRPGGLVALAPFWWEEKWWTPIAEFFVRPFLPVGFRPLRKADFANPQLRQGIAKFMPGIDLDDPAAQAAVRDFRVPLGLIDQLRRLSRQVLAAASTVGSPVLVVQGSRDSVVRASQTRRLMQRLARGAQYVEVDSEHDLIFPGNPAWPAVEAAVVEFAQRVKGGGFTSAGVEAA